MSVDWNQTRERRPVMDATLRRHAFGKIHPMEDENSYTRRRIGWPVLAILVVAFWGALGAYLA